MNFDILRKRMVEEQLVSRGIKQKNVLDAFYKVPRHKFVPDVMQASAYADYPLPIGEGQTISQPYIVALMTECLGLEGYEKVLEIGTGSGYQAAILAEIGKDVFTIERYESLANNARGIFAELGYTNIRIKIDDGTLGWPEFSPFDRIIITAAAVQIPEPLADQLKDHGRIIAPLGSSFSQTLTVLDKADDKLKEKYICGCVFVPLVGKYGA